MTRAEEEARVMANLGGKPTSQDQQAYATSAVRLARNNGDDLRPNAPLRQRIREGEK